MAKQTLEQRIAERVARPAEQKVALYECMQYAKAYKRSIGREISWNEAERQILEQRASVARYEEEAKADAASSKIASSVAETMKAWGFDAE